MSLFDYYQPVPCLHCPACGLPLEGEWQGKDSARAMFVWQQGTAAPIAQRVDDDIRWSEGELSRFRLPPVFEIYTHCCGGQFPVQAECKAVDGVWSDTVVETAANARQRESERKSDFKARLRWLSGGNTGASDDSPSA
jgi:hypothetical protein